MCGNFNVCVYVYVCVCVCGFYKVLLFVNVVLLMCVCVLWFFNMCMFICYGIFNVCLGVYVTFVMVYCWYCGFYNVWVCVLFAF